MDGPLKVIDPLFLNGTGEIWFLLLQMHAQHLTKETAFFWLDTEKRVHDYE